MSYARKQHNIKNKEADCFKTGEVLPYMCAIRNCSQRGDSSVELPANPQKAVGMKILYLKVQAAKDLLVM